ncbi:MAG TPA: isoprenylcysteine carboxylmethyltransferase family protein [Thermoanaerobaculia bacterium]|nr:isoprenylcysteine carboxylmethyltransferase family protein [Thermoanaerobaculia bacterium]
MSAEDHANVPVIPPVLFGLGIGAGYLMRWLAPVRLVPLRLEREAVWAGAALSLLGLAFGGWAFLTFVRARTTPHPNHPVSALVTWGPYRVSRNPMYVGLSGFVAGLALVANTPWLLAVLPFVWLALRRLVIDREEAYLTRRFGEEYRAFLGRTRRWL